MRTATAHQSSSSRRHRSWQLAFVIGLGSWLILACTAPHMPIVWDEGNYLFRADQIVAWFRLLFDVGNPHGGLNALSRASIQEHWLFINWSEGHPAWFAIPIAVGKGLLSGTLNPLTAARLGPITVFSIACGAIAFRLKHDYGTIAALVAPIALLTLPRMFSDAHFATQDGQLTAWWLLLWTVDSSVRRSRRTAIAVRCPARSYMRHEIHGVVRHVSRHLVAGDERRPSTALRAVGDRTRCPHSRFMRSTPPCGIHRSPALTEHFQLNLGRPDMNPFGVRASTQLPGVWAGRHASAPQCPPLPLRIAALRRHPSVCTVVQHRRLVSARHAGTNACAGFHRPTALHRQTRANST